MRGREGERERGIQNSSSFLEQTLVATAYPPLFFLDLKESVSNRKLIPRDYAGL